MGQIDKNKGLVSCEDIEFLSRFSPGAFADPKDFKKIADRISEKIKRECLSAIWKESHAILGVSMSLILSPRMISEK